jgi:hypothetical protein
MDRPGAGGCPKPNIEAALLFRPHPAGTASAGTLAQRPADAGGAGLHSQQKVPVPIGIVLAMS